MQFNDSTQVNIDKWKTYRNRLNKIIRDTQKMYYRNKIKQHNNNCLGLWKTLGSIICKKSKTTNINQIIHNNETIKDPLKMAKAFNEYFCSIGPKLANNFKGNSNTDFTKYMGPACDQSMYLYNTNSNEISKLIENLENKKISRL